LVIIDDALALSQKNVTEHV